MPECQSLLGAGLAGIGRTLRSAARLSLFLEFDGSLTPIIENPGDVRLEPSTWELLRRLANRRDVLIVIVSGRGAADLQARVGIEDIVYAGNHGLEISGKGLHFSEPFAAARRELLLRISESLGQSLSGIVGVYVEYKGLTASVHFRQAAAERTQDIERIVDTIVEPRVSPFFLDAGNMVLEVIPKSIWHKGAAVCWINSRLACPGAVSVYFGDERTGEDAFRQLSNQVTVCVGRHDWTSARFHVPDAGGVRQFLSWLEQNRPRPTIARGATDDSRES